MNDIRVGNGFDVHLLKEGQKLILGGVQVPYEKGLVGHSDADVLLHALSDSILGTLSLGDIGKHYPDTDPKYKGIDSIKLLKHSYALVQKRGYKILNVDTTILCEKPKLSNYINEMKDNISKALEIKEDRISIKATTTEKLGFIGRGEGIGVFCTCLIMK